MKTRKLIFEDVFDYKVDLYPHNILKISVNPKDIYYFYIPISQGSLEGIMIGLMLMNVIQECWRILVGQVIFLTRFA